MANWMSVAQPDNILGHDIIWHQVRHPVGVIASFNTVMGSTWRFICDNEPRISLDDSLLLRCMKYWLYWNQRCERHSTVSYRVENLEVLLPRFLKRLGVEPTPEVLAKCLKVPKNDHTRRSGHKMSPRYPKLTWPDIVRENAPIADLIRTQATKYGYNFS
jgi:hypothetical protein